MLRRFAPQCSAMISAAKSRVISRLRRGYIRPSGGLCFAAAGGKANVCRTWRHIFIDGAHGWKSVRGAGAHLPPSEGFGFRAPPVADAARKASRCRPQV